MPQCTVRSDTHLPASHTRRRCKCSDLVCSTGDVTSWFGRAGTTPVISRRYRCRGFAEADRDRTSCGADDRSPAQQARAPRRGAGQEKHHWSLSRRHGTRCYRNSSRICRADLVIQALRRRWLSIPDPAPAAEFHQPGMRTLNRKGRLSRHDVSDCRVPQPTQRLHRQQELPATERPQGPTVSMTESERVVPALRISTCPNK